jgi:periplasmic protein TonB
MTSADENRFFFPAWGISLTLHGVMVGIALALAVQIKPVLPEDLFKWDVALVEATKPESKSEQVKSVVAQVQKPAKNSLPSQIKSVSERSQAITPSERKLEAPKPTIDTVQPIEQKVEVPEVRQEPVERRIVEVAESKSEPVVETKEPERITTAVSPEQAESQPVHEPVAIASVPASSSEVPASQEAPAAASSQDSTVNAALAPSHEAKADNRWLAESLWRRVAELKRYPNSARMNGQEGKVILKAVIRADGQLADVFVQQSSGHSALDAAAIEAVKLACPLHMKHAIGKPQIVVSLPIVYSLAN